MHRALPLLLVPVLCSLPAAGQEPPPPQLQPYALDSGSVDGGASATTLVVGDVLVPAVAWLQLRFAAATNLPAGSRLRLTGMRDRVVQWFDGGSLRDYQFVSAFFNGDRVEVALVLAPGTRGNRVALAAVRCGELYFGTDLICGADTRTPSTDPRVARIDGCCTTFLVDERNLVTAGHCMGGIGGQLVNFNVPLSDPAGNPQFPPPQDQYALLPGSLTSVANGLGDDYAVMSTVRNANTGLYPGQAQGSWFTAVVPSTTALHPVRVTGYGTSAVNATWSLAQKSDTGPRQSLSASLLQYFVTVTGCNSGSPVIHAVLADQVLGVVTHAGCSGGGSNYGTGFGWAPLWNALAALRQNRVAGTTAIYGQGCAGGAGVPALGFSGFADLGSTVTVQMSSLEPTTSQPGFLLFGFGNASWNGSALPLDLGAVGMPGCQLLVAPAVSTPLFSNGGACSYALSIPNATTLLATTLHCQFFALDPTAANAAQAVSTNAGRIVAGN